MGELNTVSQAKAMTRPDIVFWRELRSICRIWLLAAPEEDRKELKRRLRKPLWVILELRYWTRTKKQLSFGKIGEAWGVSRIRVSQLEDKAFWEVRKYMIEKEKWPVGRPKANYKMELPEEMDERDIVGGNS